MADTAKVTKQASAATVTKAKSRPRSPSYPGLTLEAAIGRAKTMYEREGRNETAESVMLAAWGYKSKSGPAIGAMAAVKAFGLIVAGRGTNTYKLSDSAVRIIVDQREDETERQIAIQQAALNPPMHKVLWEKYGGTLPSDQNLLYFLRTERQFTEPGAKQFVSLYRATLTYAGLAGNDKLTQPGRDKGGAEEGDMSTPAVQQIGKPTPPTPGVREIPLPIAGPMWPSIKGAFPMSEAAWQDMMRLLVAMKSGLVAAPGEDEAGD